MAKKSTLSAALHSYNEKSAKPKAAPEAGGDRRQLSVRLEPEVIHQLKLLALQEGTTLQGLVCEGLNGVFQARGEAPIAR